MIINRRFPKRFGDFVALDTVPVEIPTGWLTAQPSGGGKSTLRRIIAGVSLAPGSEVHQRATSSDASAAVWPAVRAG